MYYVLTGGRHPLYISQQDNFDTYKKKLQGLDEFEVPSEFSWLAKSLFIRLTKISSHQRYNAREALQHPWITRKNEATIPETFTQQISNIEYERVLKRNMLIFFFTGLIKSES